MPICAWSPPSCAPISIIGGDSMAYPKIYIDATLVNWGDRLFHEALRHVRAPQLSHARLGDRAARMRAQLARTLTHAPEAMLRITNRVSGAQGMGAVRRHFR